MRRHSKSIGGSAKTRLRKKATQKRRHGSITQRQRVSRTVRRDTEIDSLSREMSTIAEQHRATTEVLKLISSSFGDPREVFANILADHRSGSTAPFARGLLFAPRRCERRTNLLWRRFGRPLPARGRLRRSHSQGRETGRPSSTGSDKTRIGDQPQNGRGARHNSPGDPARPRRRGDRITTFLTAVRMSAFGTKRTSQRCRFMPLLGVKRTLVSHSAMSAFDPKRTWTAQNCCYAIWRLNPHFTVLKSLL